MSPAEAARLLDLPPAATPAQREKRFHELRVALEESLRMAATAEQQTEYRARLAELTTAFETLAAAQPSSKNAGRRKLWLAGAVAGVVLVLAGAGGWLVQKSRAETSLRAQLTEDKTRWARFEKAVVLAEQTRNELQANQDKSKALGGVASAEQQVRLRVQSAWAAWLSPYVSQHAVKTQLTRLDGLIADQSIREAIVAEVELRSQLEFAERELDARTKAMQAELAPGSITLISEPAGASVLDGDAVLGVTPLTLSDLFPCEHIYRLKLDGHATVPVRGLVRAGENVRISLTLPIALPSALPPALPPAFPPPTEGAPYRVPQLGLELVPIPAGTFLMGKPNQRALAVMQHPVNISRPYWLGKYEVTQAEWAEVMGYTGRFINFKKGERLPRAVISWDDAVEFCQKLTEREAKAGRLPPGYGYTLPTEAQWEYACRAGSPESDSLPSDRQGWFKENCDGTIQNVGQKEPNAWGFHDMHGNVAEWCLDWYASYSKDNSTDPSGPASGTKRVMRGGSVHHTADYCVSSSRDSFGPKGRLTNTGLRVALSAIPAIQP